MTRPVPPQHAIIRLPADTPPLLMVVIDTEEEFDWSADFDRQATDVSAMRLIGRAQAVFDEFSIRPVYVIDYPVATQRDGIEALLPIARSGRCVIGAHLHPWVNPPHDEAVTRRHSFPGNLPPELERAKLANLADSIERGFGARPDVYKAGRYGFGPATAETLMALGFAYDLSAAPAYDWRAEGGPDYGALGADAYWLDRERRVLGLPTTGAFVGWLGQGGGSLRRLADQPGLRWTRLGGILSRTGAVERLRLSPEGFSLAENIRLTEHLLARGVRVLTFSFHSTSLKPGATSYVRTQQDAQNFLNHCRRYFDYVFNALKGRAATPAELRSLIERPAHGKAA